MPDRWIEPRRPLHTVRAVGASEAIGAGSIGRRLCLLALLLMAAVCTLPAQTLARPGLAGSGLKTSPWWKHAVFYRIGDSPAAGSNAPTEPQKLDFKGISSRLDALQSLGVNALLIPMPKMPSSLAPDPALDDFDQLMHQASQHGIRVLLSIPASQISNDLPDVARFWLSRGVAGFHLATPPGASPQSIAAQLETLRKITGSAVGERIVISDFNPDAAGNVHTTKAPGRSSRRASRASREGENTASQLQIDSRLSSVQLPDAANLRLLLTQSLADPNAMLDFDPPAPPPNSPNPYPALAKAMATILLTTHSATLIDASAGLVLLPTVDHSEAAVPVKPVSPPPPPPKQLPPGVYLPFVPYVAPPKPHPSAVAKPTPPDPLTAWYGKLASLHHDNAVLRYGSKTFLDFDAQNALVWVSRTGSQDRLTPPVVVVCNLSSSPIQLSLAAGIKSLGLRGTYLLTLLRSDKAMGAQDLNSVKVPPFGVYIGGLHR